MDKPPFPQQNRIKKFRELRNYTQEYMAGRLHISQNTYSNIESGKSKLTIERVKEIADILEVPFWELINDQPIFNIWNNEFGLSLNNNQVGKFYQTTTDIYEATIALLREEIGQLREEKKQLMRVIEQFSK